MTLEASINILKRNTPTASYSCSNSPIEYRNSTELHALPMVLVRGPGAVLALCAMAPTGITTGFRPAVSAYDISWNDTACPGAKAP